MKGKGGWSEDGSTQVTDPVCKMTVDLNLARTRGLAAQHAGKEYPFCSAGCKKAFQADPAKYVKA